MIRIEDSKWEEDGLRKLIRKRKDGVKRRRSEKSDIDWRKKEYGKRERKWKGMLKIVDKKKRNERMEFNDGKKKIGFMRNRIDRRLGE